MAKQKEYKKLPGKKRNLFGFNTLWLGPDHLLSIDSSIYTEKYKRFYYKDIQAITANTVRSWKVVNIILALLSALLLWLSFYLGEAGSIFFRFMGGLFFLCLLCYLLWGPSLECYLKTAIQTEKLPSLYRYRKFKKALTLLRLKIEKAQGALTQDDILKTHTPFTQQQKPSGHRIEPVKASLSSNPYKIRNN